MGEQERPPETAASEAEFAARLEEELKRLKISDVLVQTLYTISSLGYHKLGTEHRDLPQARLAIESLRALLPVLKEDAPAEVIRDFEQVVANMQLAYAAAVRDAPKQDEPQKLAEPEPPSEEEPRPDPEDLEPVDDEELGGGD
ncbi:MAG TPA: hypothetical protein VE596_00605 [Gaiellaceae bacterium]|nr:hypothetical protein [Gaiellaceae bacterium]